MKIFDMNINLLELVHLEIQWKCLIKNIELWRKKPVGTDHHFATRPPQPPILQKVATPVQIYSLEVILEEGKSHIRSYKIPYFILLLLWAVLMSNRRGILSTQNCYNCLHSQIMWSHLDMLILFIWLNLFLNYRIVKLSKKTFPNTVNSCIIA